MNKTEPTFDNHGNLTGSRSLGRAKVPTVKSPVSPIIDTSTQAVLSLRAKLNSVAPDLLKQINKTQTKKEVALLKEKLYEATPLYSFAALATNNSIAENDGIYNRDKVAKSILDAVISIIQQREIKMLKDYQGESPIPPKLYKVFEQWVDKDEAERKVRAMRERETAQAKIEGKEDPWARYTIGNAWHWAHLEKNVQESLNENNISETEYSESSIKNMLSLIVPVITKQMESIVFKIGADAFIGAHVSLSERDRTYWQQLKVQLEVAKKLIGEQEQL